MVEVIEQLRRRVGLLMPTRRSPEHKLQHAQAGARLETGSTVRGAEAKSFLGRARADHQRSVPFPRRRRAGEYKDGDVGCVRE